LSEEPKTLADLAIEAELAKQAPASTIEAPAKRRRGRPKKEPGTNAGQLPATSGNSNIDGLPVKRKKLEVSRALQSGADVLNRRAANLVMLAARYASDEKSPHHEWALKLLIERILPVRAYAGAGLAAFGIGGESQDGDRKPAVYINISTQGPATPSAAPLPGRVIDVVAVEDRSEDA